MATTVYLSSDGVGGEIADYLGKIAGNTERIAEALDDNGFSQPERALLITCVEKEILHVEEELPLDDGPLPDHYDPTEVEDARRRLRSLREMLKRLE